MFRTRYVIFVVCFAVVVFNQNQLGSYMCDVDLENTENDDVSSKFVKKSPEEIERMSSSEKSKYINALTSEYEALKRDFNAIASVDLQQLPDEMRGEICAEIKYIRENYDTLPFMTTHLEQCSVYWIYNKYDNFTGVALEKTQMGILMDFATIHHPHDQTLNGRTKIRTIPLTSAKDYYSPPKKIFEFEPDHRDFRVKPNYRLKVTTNVWIQIIEVDSRKVLTKFGKVGQLSYENCKKIKHLVRAHIWPSNSNPS